MIVDFSKTNFDARFEYVKKLELWHPNDMFVYIFEFSVRYRKNFFRMEVFLVSVLQTQDFNVKAFRQYVA